MVRVQTRAVATLRLQQWQSGVLRSAKAAACAA